MFRGSVNVDLLTSCKAEGMGEGSGFSLLLLLPEYSELSPLCGQRSDFPGPQSCFHLWKVAGPEPPRGHGSGLACWDTFVQSFVNSHAQVPRGLWEQGCWI